MKRLIPLFLGIFLALTAHAQITTNPTTTGVAALCYKTGTWTPTFNAFTVVGGSATSTATYVRVGKLVTVTVQAIGGTTIASTGGTSNITGMPYVVTRSGGAVNAASNATAIGYAASGYFNASGGIYTPTWTAVASSVVTGTYETDDGCN